MITAKVDRSLFEKQLLLSLMSDNSSECTVYGTPWYSQQKSKLDFRHVKCAQYFKDLTLSVKSNEVVGLISSDSSLPAWFFSLLSGKLRVASGIVCINDTPIHPLHIFRLMHRGVALIPEANAVLDTLSFQENITLLYEEKTSNLGFIKTSQVRFAFHSLEKEHLDQFFPSLKNIKRHTLSAFQYKAMSIYRHLLCVPDVMIYFNPTQYTDREASNKLFQIIRENITPESAALVVSSNINELLSICDVIHFFNYGQIIKTFDVHTVNPQDIRKEYQTLFNKEK